MHGQASHIREMLGSRDEAQQAQARELLRALGDGALYVEVLDGWERGSNGESLEWGRAPPLPFEWGVAQKVWMDAPLDVAFPPGLGLGDATAAGILWPEGGEPHLEKLAALPRLRKVRVMVDEPGGPPFPPSGLPARVRSMLWGFARLEDLAALAAVPRLSSLRLANCDLAPGPLPPLPRLAQLTLESCQGDYEPGRELAGSPLRHLKSADAERVGPLAPFAGLRTLDLRMRSRKADLPPDLGALRGLAALHLEGCDLSRLPRALDLPRLRWLSLWRDTLEDLPPALASLRGLRRLDLVYVDLRRLPPWLPALERLEVLALSTCPIKELPIELLLPLPRLRSLLVGKPLAEAAHALAERAWKEQGRRIAVRVA